VAEPARGFRGRLRDWARNNPEDGVLRLLLSGLIAGTIAVVALDYTQMLNAPERQTTGLPGGAEEPSTEAPSAQPLPSRRGGDRRRGGLRTADKALAAPITFELAGDGRLIATGTIDPGAATRFAAEVEKRGSYIRTVVLHSPGGSVQDALRIGRQIREKGFHTAVEDGAYCASSCPLVFAGGVERQAAPKASIGVHQIFAAQSNAPVNAADAMNNAQRISAECQRYLGDMGVDLQVWVHAMETPKDELFYFRPDELVSLKLATARDPAAQARAAP
jgi:hypothetical protein